MRNQIEELVKPILTATCLAVTAMLVNPALATPWSFGVLSDTQWSVNDDEGQDPNTIPANLIGQIDQQFINRGVKLVVDIGDSVNTSNTANLGACALYMQDLYNAGIGYYPLRGNHEADDGMSGAEFSRTYPQIGYTVNPSALTGGPTGTAGLNNATPADIVAGPGVGLDANIAPPVKTNPNPFAVGGNFSYPTAVNNANGALSYSFDYNNTRFILLDQFDTTGNTDNSTISQQQPWISGQLSSAKTAGMQTFVFGHKDLLGGNHKDNLFGPPVVGTDPGDGWGVDLSDLTTDQQNQLLAKQAAENAFIGAMAGSNAKYYVCGHDHHDYNSIVTSPDGTASVHQIISQSDSSKFYTPGAPFSGHDTPIAQQLEQLGYYIYTIDGPRVTVDYYAAPASTVDSQGLTILDGGNPVFAFTKQQTFGYSLNGKEFVIPAGGSLGVVQDAYNATRMYLAGLNGTATTADGRYESEAVDTGWTDRPTGFASDLLTLWGMENVGASTMASPATLTMSYNPSLLTGEACIEQMNADGTWTALSSVLNGDGTISAIITHDGTFGVGAVPEPSAIVLVGIAAGALAVYVRRVQIVVECPPGRMAMIFSGLVGTLPRVPTPVC